MIKFENTVTPSAEQWKAIIFGARNPLNSWSRSDSGVSYIAPANIAWGDSITQVEGGTSEFCIGPNDYDLMKRLRNAGTDHRKFMRMITVYVDVTAPLYWWKEADTYQVGVVKNSCSTMHKIHAKEFTLEDFSHEHLEHTAKAEWDDSILIDSSSCGDGTELYSPRGMLGLTVKALNAYRTRYLETKDKKYWWQMIQLLPSSYNQKRTVMLNYEVLANMYKSRKAHKLDEWVELCEWIQTLPYSELITGEFEKEE